MDMYMDRSAKLPRLSYRALEGTNTKTRRLAYLTAILTMLRHDGVSERLLLARMVRWSQEHKSALDDYWVQTGEVTSARRNSSGARYLHLATRLGLIAPVAGAYRVTRIGRVLLALIERYTVNPNPFFLTPAERLFYTHLLLERDADVLLTIADHLLEEPGIPLAQVQRGFQGDFLHRLSRKIESTPDERLKRELLDRRAEVKAWRKPERYAEHLVPPRLNWLLDLDLLEAGKFRRHRNELTAEGRRFLATLLHVGENGFSDVSGEWLDSVFWEGALGELLYDELLQDWDEVDETALHGILTGLLKDAFQAFRYSRIPKVSLSQALLCLSMRLILEHQIAASPTRLTMWLSSPQVLNGRRYEVRFSPRENESYLLATAA